MTSPSRCGQIYRRKHASSMDSTLMIGYIIMSNKNEINFIVVN
jgi:hypothetical protein